MRLYPVVRTNIAHGNLCVLLLSKASPHQGKSGLPQCVSDSGGVGGKNTTLDVMGDIRKQL